MSTRRPPEAVLQRSDAAGSPPGEPAAGTARGRTRRTLALALLLLACLFSVRATVASPVRVASTSMLPTFAAGDVVLVDPGTPDLEDLDRGDLVTFRSPEDGQRALKRVIGLPGDVIVIRDSLLYVNEKPVREPYVDHALIDAYYSQTYSVPPGTVFVMGDNRGNSVDSRDYGPVPVTDLLGRVLVRVWPPLRDAGPAPSPPKP